MSKVQLHSVVDRVIDLQTAGKLCGVTKDCVCRLERRAIRKLWQQRARELLQAQR